MANEPEEIPVGDLAIMATLVAAALLLLVELGSNVIPLFVH
jgi:hypothetical protein